MKPALLIIDVQRVLCTGEYACFDIQNVIERINALSAKARTAGVPVVFIQHEEEEGAMRHDAEGWHLDDRLVTDASDLRVRKTTPDSFQKTPLQSLLQQRGVTNLVICGLQSDFCVDSTSRGALAHGYPVTLVSDAHSTLDNQGLTAAQISAHHTETLANVTSFGPRVTPAMAAQVTF